MSLFEKNGVVVIGENETLDDTIKSERWIESNKTIDLSRMQ